MTFRNRFDRAQAEAPSLLQLRLQQSLMQPADELFARPHKEVRAGLVRLGFLLSGERHEKGELTPAEAEAIDCLGAVLETVHAGSLVVDDVQDQSPERRGQPSLHCQLGVPLAINLGNWLYFKPLEWVRELNLAPAQELAIYRLYHEALTQAHMGQALDLGTRMCEVPAEAAMALCCEAMALKTGALMSLALQLGGLIGHAGPQRMALLASWGAGFGTGLQLCNDLRSLKPGPERFHDLALQRPSFVWMLAAQLGHEAYQEFCQSVEALPESQLLEAWLKVHDFEAYACRSARSYLAATREELAQALRAPTAAFAQSFAHIDELNARICHAYV